MKTGIQVSSFRPILTTPGQVDDAFRAMAAMGCETVQLQWIDPSVSGEWIAETMKKYGITSVSVQDFYQTVLENKEYYYTLNRLTGGTWVCVSRIPERLKTLSGLNAYIEELREMKAELEQQGQKLCFHPVSGDFEPIAGVDPVDYLLERMPELELCADLYHLNRSGKDMRTWLKKYSGRIPMVHFKDSRRFPDGTEELVPTGQGDTDWNGVVDACAEAGVEYAFAEQERWQGDPFERLKEGLAWLHFQLSPIP